MINEKEIIKAVIDGADRYAELVERYHVGLIIHCEKMVGGRDDAEDIAQEAFIKAYTDLKKYNSKKARFSTWLYRIATNLCINHIIPHFPVACHVGSAEGKYENRRFSFSLKA